MARIKLLDVDNWSVNRQAVLGLVSLVLLGVLATVGVKYAFGAYEPGYDLTATFEGAGQNLDTESVVKLRGVDVGRVESIELNDDEQAVVRVKIEPDVQVPDTAVAVIRPISIFGPKFIDLIPGSGETEGPYLGEGDEITHTRSALELEDILGEADDLLRTIEPGDLTTVLHTFAQGIDGLDQEIADSITNGQTVINSMVASSEDRNAMLSSLALLADEMADEGDSILALSENTHGALPTLTEHEDDFAGLLEGTSRLAGSLAEILQANGDIMGPGIEGGANLSEVTADNLSGMVSYLDFVRTYGGALDQIVRVPVAGEAYVLGTQQFLLPSDPCAMFIYIDDCDVPPIDPGPQAAG